MSYYIGKIPQIYFQCGREKDKETEVGCGGMPSIIIPNKCSLILDV